MPPLADGTYEVMVIDVSGDRHPGARLDLVITKGEHKGDVVVVRAGGLTDDPFLLGLPGQLTVKDGRPQVRIDGTEPFPIAVRPRKSTPPSGQGA